MKLLLDFLLLRPLFTRSALFVVWYIYLAATILQLGQRMILLLTTRDVYPVTFTLHYYISQIPPILFVLAYLALVRIFLEIALQFIENRTAQP